MPAFTGLGAPYWESQATGLYTGVTRVTPGKRNGSRAVLDAIAYQINDVTTLMQKESNFFFLFCRVSHAVSNGLPSRLSRRCTDAAELCAIGVAYAAGLAVGLYDKEALFKDMKGISYEPSMAGERRRELNRGLARPFIGTLAVTHQGA